MTRFRFGEFVLHEGKRELTRAGVRVELGGRAIEILLALVRRAGHVATKEDIMRETWSGTIVAQNNLTTQIAQLRRALDDQNGRTFIHTVAGQGYRFVAEVEVQIGMHLAGGRSSPSDLPGVSADTTSFIGRRREIAEIGDRLLARPLVTVIGAGGVGKTRVALKVAGSIQTAFADGVLFVELAPLVEPNLVAEAVCQKLGVPPVGDRAATESVVLVLRDRATLLVIDNAEHVLAATSVLVESITRSCPRVRLLVTSREALGVAGEVVYLLSPLPVPPSNESLSAVDAMRSEAVHLFADRAADALGTYTLSDADAPFVAAICRRLDGMPLAMELAAARLRVLNPREIAARLQSIFPLLSSGSRTALARHQTLQATIDWSYSLLSPSEKEVLRRLSIFVDGCTLDGAVAVCHGEDLSADTVFDLLATLVCKSLVVAETAGHTTRYRMLEITRQYASAKLDFASVCDVRRRMAEFLLALFRRAEREWPTMSTDRWGATYGVEAKNFRTAVDWAFANGEPDLAMALVACSGTLVEEKSLYADLRRWTETALSYVTESTEPRIEASILYLRTTLEKRLGAQEVPQGRAKSIAIFREINDHLSLSRALRQTAMARAMPGLPDRSVQVMAEEAVALLRHLAPHKDLATALAHLGSVHFLAGENEKARRLNEAAMAMRRSLGDSTGMLASSVNLAELLFLDGNVSDAMQHASAAEAEARRRKSLATLALVLCNLAGYRLNGNDVRSATSAAVEALQLSRAIGQDYLAVMSLEHLALSAAIWGSLEVAASILGFTATHYSETSQTRERLEHAGYERLATILRLGLTERRRAALQAAGAAWTSSAVDLAALTESQHILESTATTRKIAEGVQINRKRTKRA